MDGLPGVQPLVVLVGHVDGADLGALSACGTLVQIHHAGLSADFRLEAAGFALQVQQFGVGKKLDVQVPADLDQFG
jgi:hypothetical protein